MKTKGAGHPEVKLNPAQWYPLVAILMSCILMSVGAVWYSNQAAEDSIRQSERKWCELVNTLDASWKAKPPPTESGKNVANNIRALRSELGCEGVPLPRRIP